MVDSMEPKIQKMSPEQLKVVKKLEEALNILKYKPIKNEDCLEYIKKPLDDLMSSLKFLPTEPLFIDLPTEIKTNILEYLCDSGALAATTVCEEWKEILQVPVKKMEKVTIGNHCSNVYEKVTIGNHCSNMYKCGVKCYQPEAMLKGVTNLKRDVSLTICHPLTEVDSQLVAEAVSSVSKLSILGDCSECVGDDIQPILTDHQKEQLLLGLENRSEIMTEVDLKRVDLTNLDQERLVNFLVYKNGSLSLDEGHYGPILDIRKLVEKLQDSDGTSRLKILDMNLVHYRDDLADNMADALCRVFFVNLHPRFRLNRDTAERLVANIIHRPIMMRGLVIDKNLHWRSLLNPDDLETVLDKMMVIVIQGSFTPEQIETARSCPGVEVVQNANLFRIRKWINSIIPKDIFLG